MVERVLVPGAVDERGRRASTVGDWEQRYAISIVDPARPGQPRPVALLDHRIVLHADGWTAYAYYLRTRDFKEVAWLDKLDYRRGHPSTAAGIADRSALFFSQFLERACTNMFAKLLLHFHGASMYEHVCKIKARFFFEKGYSIFSPSNNMPSICGLFRLAKLIKC